MRKANKLFQLTNLIRTKQPITAEQIAEELEVSVRTVYRYIDDLSSSGIPVYGTAGIGYQLHENFELPPLNLTEKELDALLIGVNMVSSWTGDTLTDSAKSLAKKIEAVVPESLSREHIKTIYAPDLWDRTKDRNNWELIYKAIKDSHPINISYQALDDRETSRTIYPLVQLYWGGKWTVGGWCTLRQDFRNFRLDRIVDIELDENKFEKDEIINLDAYFATIDKY
jgi:predicted DNA-binding transcriptional regulator YafY